MRHLSPCFTFLQLWSVSFYTPMNPVLPESFLTCGDHNHLCVWALPDSTLSLDDDSTESPDSTHSLISQKVYVPSDCPEFGTFTAVLCTGERGYAYAVTSCGHLVAIDVPAVTLEKFVKVLPARFPFQTTRQSVVIFLAGA